MGDSSLKQDIIDELEFEPRVDATKIGVAVDVLDTGPGIAEEVADRLFQPFVTTKAGGMGIGLSISRRIIQSHGGDLSYRRNEAGGSTFSFVLPIVQEAGNDE